MHYVFTVQYVFYLIPTLADVSMSELREGTRDLNSFWPTVMSICAQLEHHYNTDDVSLAEQLILRAEECTSVLRASTEGLVRCCQVVQSFTTSCSSLESCKTIVSTILSGL